MSLSKQICPQDNPDVFEISLDTRLIWRDCQLNLSKSKFF